MEIFANNPERKLLEAKMKAEGRLPPGQSATLKWPVLHFAGVPAFDAASWTFRTWGLVELPLELSWDEFTALPRSKVTADFHCVTRWSRFDNHWEGIPFRTVAGQTRPKPEARGVLIHGADGYTTNVPLGDLMQDDVMLAVQHDDAPLAAEHGGPVRLVVPKLYGWKSAKWITGLEFLSEDRAGFWERNGYHMLGDPFQEQRFDSD